ncbi:MAG: ATP-binding protein [Thaumarchaeota archaeon]|nr:ATP-binding protein [Nitrososphaerota archaeon]
MPARRAAAPRQYRLAGVRMPDPVDVPTDSEKGFPLLRLTRETCTLGDLVVEEETGELLSLLVDENRQFGRLVSYGLVPKQKVLLCGPPGTGKTMTARALSCTLGRPLAHVSFDAVMSSFLGQTSTNLRKIFDFLENGEYVALFDEFDIVGKKRDDELEHGEIKRVVNNFMQMVDAYRGRSLLVATTNHEHMLDTALWRRFDEIVMYGLPDARARGLLFAKYLGALRKSGEMGISGLVASTEGYSAADIAQVCENALRRAVLRGASQSPRVSPDDVSWALCAQQRRREVVEGIGDGRGP